MSEPDVPSPKPDQLFEEAAAWFARMRGPDAEASREEFEAWLRRGALHRNAYNRVGEIFAMGKLLADEDPASGQPREEAPKKGPRRLPRLMFVVAGVLLTLIAGWLTLGAAPTLEQPRIQMANRNVAKPVYTAHFITEAGQTRTVGLPDGSTLRLASATAVAVRLNSSERLFRLSSGQARFEVARDGRPFIVHAGGGTVTALGTVFEVGLSSGRRVTVELIEGSVEVAVLASAAQENATQSRLQPGETISYVASPAAAPNAVEKLGARNQNRVGIRPQARAVTIAPEQARNFESVTVEQLITEANRASSRPIRLTASAIGEQRVTGRFRIDNTFLLAERLAALFDLVLDAEHPKEIVLRRR